MELKLDLEFYARFLAMYASKIKRRNVKIDGDYTGRNVIEESKKQWTEKQERTDGRIKKIGKKYEKYRIKFTPGYGEETYESEELIRTTKKFEKEKTQKGRKRIMGQLHTVIRLFG
jgi:radical SAM superfamily enzyme YgiQ (UPF0313 family)